ncbi:MAG: hypothetical protein MSA89_00200 [Clostridium sp.]|nr:hypothetical protein [Clostridium sp.]MCI7441518.1 hypothetical protein [Clostridium sp.]
MSFSRIFNTLIVKSNNFKSELSYNNGIELHNYDSKNNLISKAKVIEDNSSFSKSFFDVDCYDNIYGIILTKKNTLLYIYIDENYIYKSKLIDIKDENCTISFPYIKKIDDKIHLFYYLINEKTSDKCKLIHYFYDSTKWIKNIVFEINYFILSNFVVTWHNDIPCLFFFSRIKKCEELFMSFFNLQNLNWEKKQLTSSYKSKVYLSVIEPLENHYHITFSENNDNKYYCSYVYIYMKNKKISVKEHLNISKTIACEFPNISMIDDKLYIQWLEFNELFTSYSKDYGKTWSYPNLFNNNENKSIIRYDYRYNFFNNKIYLSNIFSYNKDYYPLGILEEPLRLDKLK